jgi:Tfp pilus assembly protein PilW
MTARSRTRGSILVAPLVGAALGLVVLAGVAAQLAQAARWVVRADARAETHDTADLVVQAFAFDLRRTGWDPAASSEAGLAAAGETSLEIHADLDGDAAIDPTSAERVRWVYAPDRTTLSRWVGNQSMPLASTVTRLGFEYLDATGAPLTPEPTGLSPGDLARVRAVVLSIVLTPPSGGGPVVRRAASALRGSAS